MVTRTHALAFGLAALAGACAAPSAPSVPFTGGSASASAPAVAYAVTELCAPAARTDASVLGYGDPGEVERGPNLRQLDVPGPQGWPTVQVAGAPVYAFNSPPPEARGCSVYVARGSGEAARDALLTALSSLTGDLTVIETLAGDGGEAARDTLCLTLGERRIIGVLTAYARARPYAAWLTLSEATDDGRCAR